MKKEKDSFSEAPLALHLTNIAKQYLGVISNKLSHLDIDRYYLTLVVIDRFGGSVTQQQLAGLVCKDKVSMVRVIDYLSKKGFVKRKKNKLDRREYFIELTEKASSALPDIKAALKYANTSIFKNIPEPQVELFYQVLEQMLTNLETLPADQYDLNYRRTTN